MVDSSFLQALIFKDHPKHELASRMAENIDDTVYLYMPIYELNKLFDDINNIRDEKTRKLFDTICCSTRNITEISRKTQKKAYSFFESNQCLSYEECLTVVLMKLNDMRYIISFNENYDEVKQVVRLFDLDKYNNKRLNFFRYVE
jgi:predicted nucleic acid-binding protein